MNAYTPGTIVTINRVLYEVEASRPTASRHHTFKGKHVISLRKVKDGTHWRITTASLSRRQNGTLTRTGQTRSRYMYAA